MSDGDKTHRSASPHRVEVVTSRFFRSARNSFPFLVICGEEQQREQQRAVRNLISDHESNCNSKYLLRPPDTGSVPGEKGYRLVAEMPTGWSCNLPGGKRVSERRNQTEVCGQLRDAVLKIC